MSVSALESVRSELLPGQIGDRRPDQFTRTRCPQRCATAYHWREFIVLRFRDPGGFDCGACRFSCSVCGRSWTGYADRRSGEVPAKLAA